MIRKNKQYRLHNPFIRAGNYNTVISNMIGGRVILIPKDGHIDKYHLICMNCWNTMGLVTRQIVSRIVQLS